MPELASAMNERLQELSWSDNPNIYIPAHFDWNLMHLENISPAKTHTFDVQLKTYNFLELMYTH